MRSYPINIIDGDSRRRNLLARELYAKGYHVEISENVGEFLGMGHMAGVVLAWVGPEGEELDSVIHRVLRADGYYIVIACAKCPPTKLVVDAMSAGAESVIDIDNLDEAIVVALEDVLDHASEGFEEAIESVLVREKLANLSKRERQTLECMVAGHSIKCTARLLGVSPNTVRLHRSNLYFKLGASGLADAVRMAMIGDRDACPDKPVSSQRSAPPRSTQPLDGEPVLYTGPANDGETGESEEGAFSLDVPPASFASGST